MKKKDQMLAKIKRQQEITDGARAANRDLTDDETREFNNLQGEIDALRPRLKKKNARPPLPPSATAWRRSTPSAARLAWNPTTTSRTAPPWKQCARLRLTR